MRMPMFYSLVLSFISFGLGHTCAAEETKASRVVVRNIPGALMLYRDVIGSYDQHAKVARELMEYVGKNYCAVGDCFGVYPIDPDAVKTKETLADSNPGHGRRPAWHRQKSAARTNARADRKAARRSTAEDESSDRTVPVENPPRDDRGDR